MKNITTASGYRRLTLLNILFFAEGPMSKKELMDHVHCSQITLNADVQLFNSLSPPEMAHIHTENKQLFLTVAPNVSYDYLSAYVIVRSDLFALSVSIFKDEKLTIPEWTERNFISQASFYLRLKEMDTFLARSRLFLNNSPLQIEGNEINIRFFFSHLFHRCHPYHGWISDEIDYESIDLFIKSCESHMGVFFSVSSRMEYAIAICVCLTRMRQGYAAELTSAEKEIIDGIYEYYRADLIDFSSLDQFLDEPMSLIERYVILSISFQCSFTDVSIERTRFRLEYHRRFRAQRYVLAEDLISLLDERLLETDTVKLTILDYLTRFSFVKKTNLILDVDYFTKQFVPDIISVDAIQRILNKYVRQPDYAFVRDNMRVITTYLHDLFNVTLMNETMIRRLHVKVVSKSGFLWESYLQGQIRQHYSEDYVLFCEEMEPREHWPQYDLVISDYPIELKNDIPVFVWHIPPAARDFQQLANFMKLQ